MAEREGGSGSWKKTREGCGKEGSIPPRVERGSSVDTLSETGEVRRGRIESEIKDIILKSVTGGL